MTNETTKVLLMIRALQHVIPKRIIHAMSTQAALHGKAP